jgi:AcrR family transcriptional regulator
MTVDAIAARAGVGKQTVYRWWSSKAALVADAVLSGHVVVATDPPADSGDVATDLRVWLREQIHRFGDPATVSLVRGLAAAAADDDADAARLYEQLTGPSRQRLVRRLAAGVRQGQLRGDADLEAAADALIGALLYRALARTPPPAEHDADGLFDIVFTGMAAPGTHNIAPKRQGGTSSQQNNPGSSSGGRSPRGR